MFRACSANIANLSFMRHTVTPLPRPAMLVENPPPVAWSTIGWVLGTGDSRASSSANCCNSASLRCSFEDFNSDKPSCAPPEFNAERFSVDNNGVIGVVGSTTVLSYTPNVASSDRYTFSWVPCTSLLAVVCVGFFGETCVLSIKSTDNLSWYGLNCMCSRSRSATAISRPQKFSITEKYNAI